MPWFDKQGNRICCSIPVKFHKIIRGISIILLRAGSGLRIHGYDRARDDRLPQPCSMQSHYYLSVTKVNCTLI